MKNCTLGKHISKINTREETSQMVKDISQEKVKKIPFYNHFSLSTVDSGNSKRLNRRKSLISKHFWWNWAIVINYMLNSKHLSLVKKIGDKTEFTITRVHCTKFANEKLHSRKACIKTNIGEETFQMVKMSHYSARWRKYHKKKWRKYLLSQFLYEYSQMKNLTLEKHYNMED